MKPRIPSSARFPNILLRFFIFAIFHFSALTNGDAAPNPKAAANADADPQTTYVIPFTGAIFITVPNTASPAVPAVCPADHPTSCKNIGKQGWCCVSGNNCALDQAGNVGCCPYGQTCTLLVSSAQIPAKREVVSLLENCREIKLMTGYDEIGTGTVVGPFTPRLTICSLITGYVIRDLPKRRMLRADELTVGYRQGTTTAKQIPRPGCPPPHTTSNPGISQQPTSWCPQLLCIPPSPSE